MRTLHRVQRMMAWMSWLEKRKASRATATPVTWILPSSGQYNLVSQSVIKYCISCSSCGMMLLCLDLLIDCYSSSVESAVFDWRQGFISKLP